MVRAARHYVTSIDRIGLAIGMGGALVGLVATALLALGGEAATAALVLTWAFGAIAAMIGIVAIAGPMWFVLHRANRRGPVAAATLGGLIGLVVFGAGQLSGSNVTAEDLSLAACLLGALPTSLGAALVFGAIGWAMHRIAYRRIF